MSVEFLDRHSRVGHSGIVLGGVEGDGDRRTDDIHQNGCADSGRVGGIADLGLLDTAVDGGAVLLQFQADIAGVTVRRPMIRETTALGAAYLAGLATGVWRDLNDIKGQWTLDKLYEPQMEAARARELVDGWHKAVERARGWA